jgi:uncharacterized protein (DUF1810 family)
MEQKIMPESRYDPFRFLQAQETVYPEVLAELRAGHKKTHWIWFIFPQIAGLGHSATAKHYAIADIHEARDFLDHPILGARLRECSTLLLQHRGKPIDQILGTPDDLKLRSSMTLFASAASSKSDKDLFGNVLEEFYDGHPDAGTLERLNCAS